MKKKSNFNGYQWTLNRVRTICKLITAGILWHFLTFLIEIIMEVETWKNQQLWFISSQSLLLHPLLRFFLMAACCTRLSLPSQLKGDRLVPQWKCFRLELFKMVEGDFGLEISATQLRYKETALDQVSKLNPQRCLMIWTCQSFLSFMTTHLLSDVIINHGITAFYFFAVLWQTGKYTSDVFCPRRRCSHLTSTWPELPLLFNTCVPSDEAQSVLLPHTHRKLGFPVYKQHRDL